MVLLGGKNVQLFLKLSRVTKNIKIYVVKMLLFILKKDLF